MTKIPFCMNRECVISTWRTTDNKKLQLYRQRTVIATNCERKGAFNTIPWLSVSTKMLFELHTIKDTGMIISKTQFSELLDRKKNGVLKTHFVYNLLKHLQFVLIVSVSMKSMFAG